MSRALRFNCGWILAAALIGSTLSCSESPTEPVNVAGSLIIEPLTPTYVETTAGSVIPGPSVRIKDRRSGKPVTDVLVQFRPGAGGGGVTSFSARTDASGAASAGEWSISARTGVTSVTVAVGGTILPFSALVRADVPARFDEIRTTVVGFADEYVNGPPLRLVDRFGNSTPGISVALTIAAGNGAIDTSTAITDENGKIPSMRWRLGSSPGDNSIIASVNGMEPVTFHAQGLDRAALDWYVLENISIGTTVFSPTDAGIGQGKLGLTRFDHCLCTTGEGYFIVEVDNGTTRAIPFGGGYRIEGANLHLLGEPELRVASLTESVFSILDQTRVLNGNRIEIEITRWYPEFWELGTEIWAYRAER